MENLETKELIRIARECAGDLFGNACIKCVFHGSENDCTASLLKALADRLEVLCYRWVDIKSACPSEDGEYLVMISGAEKPTVLYYDAKEEGFYGEDDELNREWYTVTHWAMLPDAPGADRDREPCVKKIKRCATCRHEDKMSIEERCFECEKHNLWEERK